MVVILLIGERAILVNIYGPNRDNKLVDFYHSVLQSIKTNYFDSDNIIMGGDFNCPLNPIVDKRGGNLMPRQSVINAIESLQWELDLHDVWRIKNPTERSFTWSQPEPLVLSRLDYWLISNSISDNVCEVDIIPSIKTDHSAIKIEFKDVGDGVKGPGLWKLNCSLLRDEVYVNEINRMIPTWIYEGRTDLSDPRSVWDWVKYNIKKHSRKYSMNNNKQRRREEQLLNEQFQNAHLVFQNDPSEENLVTLNVLKERNDKMYQEEVEGIIVRSRARWHEHGEKNSRYFLNLEKRNHVKKHVRKLRLSGVITSDPFEILQAEKEFYDESLYKSRVYAQQTKASFNYDDLPIPKLSEDCKQSGEGVITLDECSKVLNSFAINKTPGNDGLPIEFYQTFWNAVGELLVESFNESFIKGEMSPSQRQAVITLIEKKDQDRCDLKKLATNFFAKC